MPLSLQESHHSVDERPAWPWNFGRWPGLVSWYLAHPRQGILPALREKEG